MSLRAIPRSAIDGTLRLVRWPLDAAVSMLPGNGAGRRPAAGVALDRADALIRDVAGVALRDEELRHDAARRRTAADERERALRLRQAANRTATRADEELDERHERAEEQRRQAARRADKQRAAAKRARDNQAKQAAATATKRRTATRKARAKVDEAIEEEASETKLEQLVQEGEALDQRAEALTAEAEAQRLQDAASQRKAARKRS
ncbi:MAG: hypothetical protein ACRDLS_06135 [Solirubrobacteraceae bacterium]